ncbi:MmgE/PrpD family protein [Chelatococcus reniformis]|uniref:MmgE/PrpD family protein n=1 Tax=Chelatococcus reniformis TaxID=1494448 RepID=A0A916UE45_9HYPH|nr:MmgE/PrpD family protein [Chelatococcus reniformis]GGC70066.1 hypothetical protein GCM10010994_30790 [Chelatococcus reniformis]
MSDGPTSRLGRFAASGGNLMTRPAADKAAFCLLDAIGLAALATDEPTTVATRSVMAELPAAVAPASRVWNDGARVAAADAVLANAVATHAQFHDDSDNASWTHPGSFVIPVAVTGAELIDAALPQVLTAIAIGYGAVEWLGARERVARALIERGIRTSPTLGTVAAAAAGAAILGLDEGQATSAIGIASSITGGVLEPVGAGSDEWRLQNGHAARGGLLAAQLAQKGVKGAPAGLEGPKGLLRSLAGLQSEPPEWASPPRLDAICDTCAKPWATLGDNMSAVIAASVLRKDIADVGAIRRVEVKIWRHYAEYPGTAYTGPFERVAQAIASMTFSTAAMLVYGELEYDKPQHHRQDPDILRLVPLIEIVPDDDGGPYDATVTVELADGRRLSRDASDAPRTLLFHDRSTSAALIARRMDAAGRPAGLGLRLAEAAFDAADGKRQLPLRSFLDLVTTQN